MKDKEIAAALVKALDLDTLDQIIALTLKEMYEDKLYAEFDTPKYATKLEKAIKKVHNHFCYPQDKIKD